MNEDETKAVETQEEKVEETVVDESVKTDEETVEAV